MERLRRELEEKLAEMTRIKANLQSSEKVSVHPQTQQHEATSSPYNFYS